MTARFVRPLLSTPLLALLLSACGGGGGGAPTIPAPPVTPTPPPVQPPPPPTPPTPTPGTNLDSTEYQRSAGAVQANALAAYSAGATGRGVIAGVIDSGIDANSAEFAGRISPASIDLVGARGLQDEGGHGTAVAGVLAAARNETGPLGIAYDSTLLVLRTDTAGSCVTDDGCKHNDTAIARAIDVAVANRARVINISLGGETGGFAFQSAVSRATAAGVVIVMSAGNDMMADPDGFSLIANNGAVARGQVIIAGASNLAGDIADFSNKAGVGSASYLMALGERVRSFDQTGAAFLYSGTSFSAPLISGAVALLAQAFPNLSGREIVQILYDTAVDLGPAGVDATYGHGRLDLTRAFQPRGGSVLAGSAITVATDSNGATSAPMGDAGRRGASAGAVVLDGYGRAYALDLGRTLSVAAPTPKLFGALGGGARGLAGSVPGGMFAVTIAPRRNGVALDRLMLDRGDAMVARATAGMVASRIGRDLTVGVGVSQGAATVSRAMTGTDDGAFLVAGGAGDAPGFERRARASVAVRHAFGRAGVTVSAERGEALVTTRLLGNPGRSRFENHGYATTGATVDRRLGPVTLAAGLSRLEERETVLGGRFGAALGGGGATSDFVDLSVRADAGNGWRLSGAWREGRTRGEAGGAARDGARLASRSWSVDVAKAGLFSHYDRFGLRIAQPLRVERGGFALTLPTGYDYATGVTETALRRLDLAPAGRELDVEGSFGRHLLGGWMSTNLYYRRDPGHFEALPDDIGAALRYSVAF